MEYLGIMQKARKPSKLQTKRNFFIFNYFNSVYSFVMILTAPRTQADRVPNSQTVAFDFIGSKKSYTVSKGLTSRQPDGRPLKVIGV